MNVFILFTKVFTSSFRKKKYSISISCPDNSTKGGCRCPSNNIRATKNDEVGRLKKTTRRRARVLFCAMPEPTRNRAMLKFEGTFQRSLQPNAEHLATLWNSFK